MNAIDIVKEQVKAYEKGIAHAVVTIVHSDGSTPRTNGKMLVYSNGATKGTIGGMWNVSQHQMHCNAFEKGVTD